MIKFFIAISALFLAACVNHKKAEQITETEAMDFIKGYDAIWEKRDTSRMKEVMDEKYIYFTSVGTTSDLSGIISWFTPADKYKVDNAVRNEISITVNGNLAIVSSRWTGSGTFGDEKFNDDQRCSLVLQKMNGKIKLISEHCTQINRQE